MRTECVMQSQAWEAEGAVDGPAWSWSWNVRQNNFPFISQGMGSGGQFSQVLKGAAEGSLGGWVRGE